MAKTARFLQGMGVRGDFFENFITWSILRDYVWLLVFFVDVSRYFFRKNGAKMIICLKGGGGELWRSWIYGRG